MDKLYLVKSWVNSDHLLAVWNNGTLAVRAANECSRRYDGEQNMVKVYVKLECQCQDHNQYRGLLCDCETFTNHRLKLYWTLWTLGSWTV